LLPFNWLRPKFRFTSTGQQLFEIRLSAASQKNNLVVYTDQNSWIMDKSAWLAIAGGVRDDLVTVDVWGVGGTSQAATLLTRSHFTVALVEAPGSIVYWTIVGGRSANQGVLKSFSIGDESVAPALQAQDVKSLVGGYPGGAGTAATTGRFPCVGCHSATPDGEFFGFAGDALAGSFPMGLASAKPGTVGQAPSFLTAPAAKALKQDLGMLTFSKAHWTGGDHLAVSTLAEASTRQLVWIDLEASAEGVGKAFGTIARTNDARGAWSPSWSHDGTRVVYTSANVTSAGTGFSNNLDLEADIRFVPFSNKQGGPSLPLSGAALPGRQEFVPAFSPDDQLVAFNVAAANTLPYDAPSSEIHVVSANGSSASTRLSANDPPGCINSPRSPGITNSYPKWAPEASRLGSKTYYWLTFSSKRTDLREGQSNPDGPTSQLYVTPVVVEGATIISYPAIYLWNQPIAESNHTPAWEFVRVPPVIPR